MGPITHVATREPVAALTFDDGPHPVFTPALLEVLARHRARATFFMVGVAAAARPDLVEQVRGAGHEVANHTYHHAPLATLGHRGRRAEIRACHRALASSRPRLFRAPFGALSAGADLDAMLLGYRSVSWSVDVGDWWNDDASSMAADLVRRTAPGSVVLLHDSLLLSPDGPPLPRPPHVDRRAMLTALDAALDHIGRRLAFVTVTDLLRRGRTLRRRWS
jgi:peptidoglycan/xylan/chitin deacetylase (PgdA/CDA1 family)